jgi:hypothetical protein
MATSNISRILVLSFSAAIFALNISGCAELNPIDASRQIMKNPLGTDPIRVGMSKEEIKSIWGEPGRINNLEPSDQWQTPREEWVYVGRYSKIPLDKSYIFKSKYLIFDGNNLVCIGDETQCKATGKAETQPAGAQSPVGE